jgi:methionyl-tRNA synthetase
VRLQSIFRALHDAGQLQERETEQLYSEALGKFLADRFVTGTCPKCGYEVCTNPCAHAARQVPTPLC